MTCHWFPANREAGNGMPPGFLIGQETIPLLICSTPGQREVCSRSPPHPQLPSQLRSGGWLWPATWVPDWSENALAYLQNCRAKGFFPISLLFGRSGKKAPSEQQYHYQRDYRRHCASITTCSNAWLSFILLLHSFRISNEDFTVYGQKGCRT